MPSKTSATKKPAAKPKAKAKAAARPVEREVARPTSESAGGFLNGLVGSRGPL
jgi:hypothetical protein